MLLFATKDFYMITLADDGQADLFHPHRNHLAALNRGVIYYQVTPDFYAFLRHNREELRERTNAKKLDLAAFQSFDARFMAIRTWAISYHGELAIRSAVSAFSVASFALPKAVYRPKPGEVLLPKLADANPAEISLSTDNPPPLPSTATETAERLEVPSLTEINPSLIPERQREPQRLIVETSPGQFIQDAPLPNEPIRSVNLTTAQADRLRNIREQKPEALDHCQAVVKKSIDEIARIYFTAEGKETPYCWTKKEALRTDSPEAAAIAKRALADLSTNEIALEEAAAIADIEATERAAILYLAVWRRIIYRYDDHVTESRRVAAEAEREIV